MPRLTAHRPISACPGKVGSGFPKRTCADARTESTSRFSLIGMRSSAAARLAPPMLCVALLGSVLAGCSSTGVSPVMFFADPGKYQYHNCEQLTAAHKSVSVREQELRDLIE